MSETTTITCDFSLAKSRDTVNRRTGDEPTGDELYDGACANFDAAASLEEKASAKIDMACQCIAQLFEREGGEAGFLRWCIDEMHMEPAAPNVKYKVFHPIVRHMAGMILRDSASQIAKIAGALTEWYEHYREEVGAQMVAEWMGQHGGYHGVYEGRLNRLDNASARPSPAASATTTTQRSVPQSVASEAQQAEPQVPRAHAAAAPETAPPEVPQWRIECESDTMEEIDESAFAYDGTELAAELAALGPEPQAPPEPPEPRAVSDGVKRFVGALKLAISGATKGERSAGIAAVSRMPNGGEIVEKISDAVQRGIDPGATWKLIQDLRDAVNASYARVTWWQKRCETLERARYRDPERAQKNRDTMAKNLDRARRVVSNMRIMMSRLLQDGIPRTRDELDQIVKEASLSQAKEFREWLDAVWSRIEAVPTVDPELILLRQRNAALSKQVAALTRENAELEATLRQTVR